MSNSGQYRDNWYSLAPPWLTTSNAEKYMYTLELLGDLLEERMNQAIRIRLPGLGDVTQLPYLANDRGLVQGTQESDASLVVRLRGAIATWKRAGTRGAILEQLQSYFQGLQPGVSSLLPEMTIVGQSSTGTQVAVWDTIYLGDAIGATPSHAFVSPSNFDWDGQLLPKRAWLILFMALAPVGLGGSAAQTLTATAGSYQSPGQSVGGVWVPATSGTPVNFPWLTIAGLSGLGPSNIGQWITISGSSHAANNGTFPIVSVGSSSDCVISNPNGVQNDTGPLAWSIEEYQFIGPGPVWGSPGYVFGQGELITPPVDTGKTIGGVWQPSTPVGQTFATTFAWGLSVPTQVVSSIRSLVKQWKSAATYYPYIVIAFDGGTGVAGSAYSPNSAKGSGNPDGSFGSVGKNVGGVWVPSRSIMSAYDAYCQGTGTWNNCSVENQT